MKLHAYYLFGPSPLPTELCVEIDAEIRQLSKIQNKEQYAKEAYNIITTRYDSDRIHTVLKAFDLFSASLQDLWNRTGFMHCTNQNYLLALLLIKGGHFTEADIKRKWGLIAYCSPHQYLQVRVSTNKWIDIDCWARHYGIGFGGHATGFNTTLRKSFVK